MNHREWIRQMIQGEASRVIRLRAAMKDSAARRCALQAALRRGRKWKNVHGVALVPGRHYIVRRRAPLRLDLPCLCLWERSYGCGWENVVGELRPSTAVNATVEVWA